jgi:hypothetical protein
MPRSLLLLLLTAAPLAAQTPTAKPIPTELEVDHACRIVTQNLRNPARPHLHYDSGICHLESVLDSQHMATTIRNGVTKRTLVEVREREYVLQNPYPQPITFTVKQTVPKKFHIDSDPPPAELANSIATFHVTAEPGQTVRLHVGESD